MARKLTKDELSGPTKGTKSVGKFIGKSGKDARQYEIRAQYYAKIVYEVRKQKLKQGDLMALWETSQPRVSNLLAGMLKDFSVEMLDKYLGTLSTNYEFKIIEKTGT